jgi:Mrp family chromosome partitioning ATPase
VASEDEVRYEAVFRERWRDRKSQGVRPGEVIRQPGWIDAGLVALGILLAVGVIAAGAMTTARSEALPAAVQGTSVSAVLVNAPPPSPGTPVVFRDTSGTEVDGVIVDASPVEALAELQQPSPASSGTLVVPAGRQRLISLLLPKLW